MEVVEDSESRGETGWVGNGGVGSSIEFKRRMGAGARMGRMGSRKEAGQLGGMR